MIVGWLEIIVASALLAFILSYSQIIYAVILGNIPCSINEGCGVQGSLVVMRMLISIYFFIMGLLTLALKNIGRMMNLIVCWIAFFFHLYGTISPYKNHSHWDFIMKGYCLMVVIISWILILFFAHPNVKKQFKKLQNYDLEKEIHEKE